MIRHDKKSGAKCDGSCHLAGTLQVGKIPVWSMEKRIKRKVYAISPMPSMFNPVRQHILSTARPCFSCVRQVAKVEIREVVRQVPKVEVHVAAICHFPAILAMDSAGEICGKEGPQAGHPIRISAW